MPAIIQIPDDLLAVLRENAEARGEDVDSYAIAALRDRASQDAELSAYRTGKPLAQYVAEQRARYNLPADWPAASRHRMTTEDWDALDAAFAASSADSTGAA